MEIENCPSQPPSLPGYELERRLGSGGTSTVWLARQLSLDRVVAIKILSPNLLADEEARRQFQSEARAAARISHAAIVGILDFGEHEGTLYYVMEYVAGTNLAEWIHANHRMAHGQALKLAEIIAGALDLVWRETSLIHCDVKPGNILLGADGAVKLTDLGLARIAGSAATREPSSCIEGTPSYIAPEQIVGIEPDCRSDIYSLGLTLYHLLTGAPPFEGRSLQEILDAQQSDFLPDPCDLLPRLPVSYGWLLAKMTAKDPARRPQTWAEVLKDLHQIKTGKSPLPPYPGEDESTILLNPRHRPSTRANTINLSPAAKKAITLSASHDALIGRPKPSAAKAASGGGLLRFLLFLLFFGGVLAALWFFVLKDSKDFQTLLSGQPRTPPPIAADPASVDALPAQTPAPETPADPADAEPPPLSAGTGTVTPGAWNHPGFIQAAELFNKSLAAYREALADSSPGGSALSAILADAQYAALLFETIRPDAPPSVPVTLYANQCYQLVNDVRRARMAPEDKKNLFSLAPKKRNETLAPYPTPAVDPADKFAKRHMQFGYAWETLPAPIDRIESTEFVLLLSTIATPSADTRAQAGVAIHGPLRWMMDLGDACRVLRAKPTPRVPIEGAPFPYGGFFKHEFGAGRLGGVGPGQPPYPSIRLICDSEDRLVAVQLFDDKPGPPLQTSPAAFSGVSKIMDFVTGRSLPDQGDLRAHHRTLKGEGTLRIDTEVADFADPNDVVPVFRSVLLLPQSVANNLLYHLLGGT
jgi:serine/threonine protein kinase